MTTVQVPAVAAPWDYYNVVRQHYGYYYLNILGEQTRTTTTDGTSTDPYYTQYSHYNAFGQMVGSDNSPTRQRDRFGFDGLGRRVKGTWDDPNASTFYDGHNVVQHRTAPYGATVTADYLHGPGVDAPLVENVTGQSACYYATVGNRLVSYFSSNGLKCSGTRWGETGHMAGAIASSYSFGQSRSDEQSGVSYYRNRMYDSRTGRFTSQDPIGFAGGMNLYTYSGNNPATFTDPFGLCKETGDDVECIDGYAPIVVEVMKGGDGAKIDWGACTSSIGLAVISTVADAALGIALARAGAFVLRAAMSSASTIAGYTGADMLPAGAAALNSALASEISASQASLMTAPARAKFAVGAYITDEAVQSQQLPPGGSPWDYVPVVGSAIAWGRTGDACEAR